MQASDFAFITLNKLFFLLFLVLIGLAMLMGAFVSFQNTQEFLKNALTTDGTVIELLRSKSQSRRSVGYVYSPRLEFTTQRGTTVEFTSPLRSSSPAYSVGEIVEVLYLESPPRKAKINNYPTVWGQTGFLGSVGSLLFLWGFLSILLGVRKGRKFEYLRKNGVWIRAKIQKVKINRFFTVNNRNPLRIRAEWHNPTTSETHIFVSEVLWFNRSRFNYNDYINTDEVTVLIEGDNPKKYYVDISFLPIGIFR